MLKEQASRAVGVLAVVVFMCLTLACGSKSGGQGQSSSGPSAPLATAIQGKWKNQYGGAFNFTNGKWSGTENMGSGSYKIVDEQTIDREDARLPGRPVRYTVTFAGDTMTMTDKTGLKIIYTRAS